jgi:hypothetical protein
MSLIYVCCTFPVLLSCCRGRQLCTWPPHQPWHWPWLAYSASMLRHYTFDNRYHEPLPTLPARGRWRNGATKPINVSTETIFATRVCSHQSLLNKQEKHFTIRWLIFSTVHLWQCSVANRTTHTTKCTYWKTDVPCVSVNIQHHNKKCFQRLLIMKLVIRSGY